MNDIDKHSFENELQIAKWFGNKRGAISLRFDDSCETHVNTAVPILNKYGMKGTFMVNPGRKPYQKHKEFWEKQIIQMGHDLGNHTWNHCGAKSLKKAEFEIGAVSKLIWKLQPRPSKLLVFASGGGGKKWGGLHWRDAEHSYKQLIDKYHLIDLYDGFHPCISAGTNITTNELINAAKQSITEQKHQAFTFHRIDRPAATIKGLARYIIRGFDITIRKKDFIFFVQELTELKHEVWIAPLIDILKYEEEYKNASLKLKKKTSTNDLTVDLKIETDPDLFDHPLTLVLKDKTIDNVEQITKLGKNNVEFYKSDGQNYIDVEPVESRIVIKLL